MALSTRIRGTYAAPYDTVQREFDAVLGKLFNGTPANGTRPTAYAVDVREDAGHFYVEAELPGFKKDEIEITLEKQQLTISAQRNEPSEQEAPKGELLLNERRYNRFQRSFTLPATVDEQAVNAKLENGVLTITLNKREESKPRKIAVN